MSGNRSLDEFEADSETTEGTDPEMSPTGSADRAASQASADTEEARDEPIEPVAETFAWSAAGTECPVCGETVQNRWRDADELVCEDCKAW